MVKIGQLHLRYLGATCGATAAGVSAAELGTPPSNTSWTTGTDAKAGAGALHQDPHYLTDCLRNQDKLVGLGTTTVMEMTDNQPTIEQQP